MPRSACRGDADGNHLLGPIPLPGGEGRPTRLSTRAEHDIPIHLATLSPRKLRLTGEIADGWPGTSFMPEGAKEAYFDHLDAGLAASGRSRADLDICQGAEVAFRQWAPAPRTSTTTPTAARAGPRRLRRSGSGEHHVVGDETGRAVAVSGLPAGTEDRVRARLRVWRDAGIDTVRLYPAGDTLDARLTTLGRAIDLVRDVERDTGR
ncbi:LLM class flavin-dependent oxidoreductase [Streptomyces sp. Go-475]|uniref:LLM class flavin-dependent oxidoreductase n=1 Tax=Streptomyces sp. Go-475 TaxID=2072505 RepID=UPI000DF07A06|nr:LLM class flavin-dependent oxidoreductase [Streptomyces sp. Go-475]AXE84144.1 Luciferase-like monooxygenase [Streptomyces sp. Go-475]